MANTTGNTNQSISLPQRGRAFKGIGETFAHDLFAGTGSLTVPIARPPERNGFQPQLSLDYSNGNGNGLFGVGWNLKIPGMSRKTSRGIPRCRYGAPILADRDTFILSEARDAGEIVQKDLILEYGHETRISIR